ncbi:12875_t:CDS:2, partial [Entrophospora sp. SA101]
NENELVADIERDVVALRNPITTESFLNPVEESEIEEPLEENSDENLNEEEDSDEESELPAIPIKEGLEALEKGMTCLL